MLHVALLGRLAEQVEALRRAEAHTAVTWGAMPSGPQEQARVDLFLRLRGDAAGREQRQALRRHQPAPEAEWEAVPEPAEADQALQDALEAGYGFVVGFAPAMHEVCRWIRSVAHQVALALDLRTLVAGETGTGKELVAQAIHRLGPRAREPFVPLNCGALPKDLIGSELFGHQRGAFTGAVSDREGALRRAGKGTVFLDEIGEMPPDLQAQLLRVLEQRAFSPLGSDRTLPLQAQIVSATNRALDVAVRDQTFRSDLYYRLAQVPIWLPPLRERLADVPLLVRSFLRGRGAAADLVGGSALEALCRYDWPGNVRELRSAVDRFLLLSYSGQAPADPNWFRPAGGAGGGPEAPVGGTLAELRDDFEKRVLQAVLARCDGDTARAAKELGVTRRSIYNLLRRHDLAPRS
jgi:transcriptional regulator with GAF, ATPase, and Fis domain